MARKVLIEGYGYSFDKDNRKVTIQKFIPEERLILITNVTKNKVIYNFSDPSLGYSSYSNSFDPTTGNETCLITLVYDTTLMSNSDQLQILIDEDAQLITPSQTYMDPTNKMRVVQPQSLIDTDFEYGTQFSKWEAQGLIGNRPYFYASPTVIPNITSIGMPNNSKTVTITTSTPHGLSLGTPILVLDTFFGQANGNFVVETVPSTTQVTFTARAINNTTTTELLDPNKTAIYQGNIFANAAIGVAPTAISYNGTTGATVVTTSIPHGLALGNEIAMIGVGGMTGTLNGNYVVAQVNSATQFTYYAAVSQTGTPTGTAASATAIISAGATGANSSPVNQQITNQITIGTTGAAPTYTAGSLTSIQVGSSVVATGIPAGTVVNAISTSGNVTTLTLSNVTTQAVTNSAISFFASVYVRPQAQTNHRPFDGGVLFSNNSLSNFSTNIRQSRRYFRYQSGKGIQVSSGTILKPYSGLDQMTAGARITAATGNGTTVTYTAQNNFLPGQVVTISGLGISSGSSLNLSTVTIASASSTQFTVTNSTVGTASAVVGLALGNTVTVQTKERHNLTPGTVITVTGSTDVNYNGTFTVTNVLAWNRYQYVATNTPTQPVAPGAPAISIVSLA